MNDRWNPMVEYGGRDAKAKENPKAVSDQRISAARRFVS